MKHAREVTISDRMDSMILKHKQQTIVVFGGIFIALLCGFIIVFSISQAEAKEYEVEKLVDSPATAINDIHECHDANYLSFERTQRAKQKKHQEQTIQALADIKAYEEEQARLAEEAQWASYDYSYSSGGGYTGYHGDPNGLNNFNGTNNYNGRTEAFYGGAAVYTDQLWLDDDGCYRTSEGYYAVATNNDEIPQGQIIETSKGQAMVVDGGADSGVVDFYTNGWY